MEFEDFGSASPFVPDRAMLHAADDLLRRFGGDAALEASARADASRRLGNANQFARWRQIERLIALLASETVRGTIH